jgi:hypothetical protein
VHECRIEGLQLVDVAVANLERSNLPVAGDRPSVTSVNEGVFFTVIEVVTTIDFFNFVGNA